MRWNGRTRCALVCIGFVLLFSAFSFRLVYLQLVKHDEYAGLAAAGLCYVYLSLQLHRLGDQKKALETELAGLRTQSDVANVQIAALTSRNALQRRLKEGYLKMVPIAEQNIVRLAPMRPAPEENAIRPVVNEQVGR